MRQPSAPAKSMPRSRASSGAAGPMCSLPFGYRSRWCTQNRNGSTVAHWKPSGTVWSTGSITSSRLRAMRAGEASITAQRVAAHRLTYERVPAEYGDPDADIRLAEDVAAHTSVDLTTPMSRYL